MCSRSLFDFGGGGRSAPVFPAPPVACSGVVKDCKATSYGGKLQGFKIKGQGYKDAIMPNRKNVDAPFLVKESK